MTSVDSLQAAIRTIIAERQGLRQHDAGPVELEQNRLELVRRQQQLSHALIDRHVPQRRRDAA